MNKETEQGAQDVTVDDIEQQLRILEDESDPNSSTTSATGLPKPSNGEKLESKLGSSTIDRSTSSVTRNEYDNFIYDEYLCSFCNLAKIDINCGLNKEEINYLLYFILHRIKSWVSNTTFPFILPPTTFLVFQLPEVLTNTMAPDGVPEWLTEAERCWRGAQLFYQPMDMAVLELKIKSKEYSKLFEFYADVITIQHNVAVYHGSEYNIW